MDAPKSLPWFIETPDPRVYLTDNYIVVDFETDTSAGPMYFGHARHPENQLLLTCWKFGKGHPQHYSYPLTYRKWGNELEQEALLRGIEQADYVVAHNAKYELGWFKRMGVDLRDVLVFDTKLAEYVLLGNLAAGSTELGVPPHSTSLDMCCRRRGLPVKDPVVDVMIANGINPVRIPRPWLQGRCEQDVRTTEAVFLDQRKDLHRRGLIGVQYTRCLLTPLLAEIEMEGMAVDPAMVLAEYDSYSSKLQGLQTLMDQLTGGINVRSVPQMAHFVYGKQGLGFAELTNRRGEPLRNAPTKQFPDGAPKTDNDTLDKLEATTDRQRDFLALRKELGKVQAMLSKNLEFYRSVAQWYGGVFYGEINQTRTATHRTASSGVPLLIEGEERRVQFQNQPRALKKIIKPKRAGFLFAEPDGSQIEFRVAGELGQDAQAIKDITNPDFDAHTQTASVIYAVTQEAVKAEKVEAQAAGRDDWRTLAKPDTFKPLYGGKHGTPEQVRYYKWFRQHYAGIAKTQAGWVNEVAETKQLRTPWGLIYYFPTAKRDARGNVNVETNVSNYPVQALATAEIIPIAAVYLWHRLRAAGLADKVFIVNMVHDSVPSEVHPDAVEEFTQLVKRCFTLDVYEYLSEVYGFQFDRVPLGVGIKIGDRWGAGKEQAFDIYRDGREVKRK